MAASGDTTVDEGLNALSWVHDELRRSLEATHKSLRRYLKAAAEASDLDPVEPSILRQARAQLHQAVGATELIGLGPAGQLLHAAEAVLHRFTLRPKLITPAAVDTVERGSFALLDYIGRRLANKQVTPLALFPQYRALQELAGASRIHPADLWPTPFTWRRLPTEPAVPRRHADAQTIALVEADLLAQMRGAPPSVAARMSEVFASLAAGLAAGLTDEGQSTIFAASQAPERRLATLWQLAAAFYEALADGLLASDVNTKRMGSRLLAQLRAGDHNEPPVRLAHDLLFFCGQAAPRPGVPLVGQGGNGRLATVRRVYGLADEPVVDFEVARLGRHDPASVAQARKRVASAKDLWSAVAGGDLARLGSLGEQMALVADSLQRLYPEGEQLGRALQAAAQQTLSSAAEPPAALAMEVATALLYLDASLDDGDFDQPELPQRVQRLAQRIDQVRQRRDPGVLELWMEDLYRRVSGRQTMGSVVQELRATLSDVENHIDQYFRNPAQRDVLIPVPAQLQAMRGVLSVLGLDQASQAVLRMSEDVDALADTEADPHRAVQSGTFDRLADNLGALSFLIDMVAVQPQMAKSLFRYDAASGSLMATMARQERPSGFANLDQDSLGSPTVGYLSPDTDALAVSLEFDRLVKQARVQQRGSPLQTLAPQAPTPTPAAATPPPARPEPPPARTLVSPAELPDEADEASDAEMRQVFLDEARELIASAREGLVALDLAPHDRGRLTAVRRAFHTLKGSARMVGLKAFGEAAWACEQAFNARLSRELAADAPLREFSRGALDELAAWVEAVANGRDQGLQPDGLVARAQQVGLPEPGAASPQGAATGSAAPELSQAPAAAPPWPASGALTDHVADLPSAADLDLGPAEPPLPVPDVVEQPAGLDWPLDMPTMPAPLDAWPAPPAPAAAPVEQPLPDLSWAAPVAHSQASPVSPARPASGSAAPAGQALPSGFPPLDEPPPALPLDDDQTSAGMATMPMPLDAWPQPQPPLQTAAPVATPPAGLADTGAGLAADAPAWAAPSAEPAPQALGSPDFQPYAVTAPLLGPAPDPQALAAGHEATMPLPGAVSADALPPPATHWPSAPEPTLAEGRSGTADAFDPFDPLDATQPLPTLPTLPIGLDSGPGSGLGTAPAQPLTPDLDLGGWPEAAPLPSDAPAPVAQDVGRLDLSLDDPAGLGEATAPLPWLPSEPPNPSVDAVAEPVDLALDLGPAAEPAGPSAGGPAVASEPVPAPLTGSAALTEPAPALPPADEPPGEYRQIGPLRISVPLLNIFLHEADEQSRQLEQRVAAWRASAEAPVDDLMVARAHSLAGNAGTVGYIGLLDFARTLEHALERLQPLHRGQISADEAALVGRACDEVRRVLHLFAAGFLAPPDDGLRLQLAALGHLPPGDAARVHGLADEGDGEGEASVFGRSGFHESAMTPFMPSPELPARGRAAATEARVAFDDEIDQQDLIDPELFPVFEEEAQELLPRLHGSLRDWVAQPEQLDAASACMRSLHTFKGGARLAGAMRLGELAHRLETEVEHLMARELRCTAADVERLVGHADTLNQQFDLLRGAPALDERAPEPHTAAAPPAEGERPVSAFTEAVAPPAAQWVAEPMPEPAAGSVADPVAERVAEGMAEPLSEPAAPAWAQPLAEPSTAWPAPAPVADTPVHEPPAAAAVPVSEPVPEPSAELVPEPAPEPVAQPLDTPPTPALQAAAPLAAVHSAAAHPAAAPVLPAPVQPDAVDWSRFFGAVSLPAEAAPAARQAAGSVRVRAALLDRLAAHAGEVSIARARMETEVHQLRGALGDLSDNLERLRAQLRDIELQAESQIASRLEAARAAQQQFDPLEMDRFTRFQELTRIMAESVGDVATVQRGLQRSVQATEDTLAHQHRMMRDMQDDLLRTRLVEFEGLSERLYRVVRQAAKETGKPVRLDIVGGSIEVDRGVLDRMTPAFEHLLRNSVVHGIEPPEQRAAAGKDPTGTVTLSVGQIGNEVAVEVRDDGAGLHLERIRDRARAVGLIGPDAEPEVAELANLIFQPGFTTASEVTDLAGRGVGMDVVRTEVAAIGGRIETATAAGQGASFRLVLPLTTAVTQVVMLRCGERAVAVPATLVESVTLVPAAEVEAAYAKGQMAVGDRELPFFWLDALLQGPARGLPQARSASVVVVRSGARRVVLHVDEVQGNQEVVVKHLGPQLSRLPGLVGMTLLPSGLPALIYNPVLLAATHGLAVQARVQRLLAGGATLAPEAQAAAEAAPLVMVVDDSLTVRRVTQRLLEREGCRVLLAKDGQDALDRLQSGERPAVVLSDIEMPRLDGFDLLRAVRAHPRLADLPVVMITSRLAQKHRDYAIELGANHYLGKPYVEDELLRLVRQYAPLRAAAHTTATATVPAPAGG